MIRNQLRIVSEEQIYNDRDIVFTDIFHTSEEKGEKLFYIDGKDYDYMEELAMGIDIGINESIGSTDALLELISDYFVDDENLRYIIVVKNLGDFLKGETEKRRKFWKKAFEEMVYNLENDEVVIQNVNRKIMDIYLTHDDIDFDDLEEFRYDGRNAARTVYRVGASQGNVVVNRRLPIGTVVDVRLYFREGIREVKRFMIVERFVETDAGYYQYKGIEYPSNTVYTDDFVLFNGNNVDFIAFEGVTDLYDERLVDKALDDLKSRGKELIELPIGINNER